MWRAFFSITFFMPLALDWLKQNNLDCSGVGLNICYYCHMPDLLAKKCRPCELDEGKLDSAEIETFMAHVPKWSVRNNHEISRRFKFKNFKEALEFVNKIGALAEEEGHHPDIEFGWGYVEITLFTHAVGGLSENDFIMAAKINELLSPSLRL